MAPHRRVHVGQERREVARPVDLEQRLEARHAEGLPGLVLGLDQAVGEQEEGVPVPHLDRALLVAAARVEARGAPGRGEPLGEAVPPQHELRVVPGVDVAQAAGAPLQQREEEGVVGREGLVAAHLAVERLHEPREVGLGAQARADRRLEAGHEESGPHALAGDVAHEDRHLVLAEREVVEEVAAHLARRDGDAAHLGERPEERPARQQDLLDAAADLQLLAQAFLLEEALLVPAQVPGQEVERLREVPELAAVGHRDAHVEVAGGEPPGPFGERGEVPGHAARQGEDAEERDEGLARGRARGCSPRCAAISWSAGPTGRATAITIPVSGSGRSATTHSPASRRVTGFPGTCPSAASNASSAGSGA